MKTIIISTLVLLYLLAPFLVLWLAVPSTKFPNSEKRAATLSLLRAAPNGMLGEFAGLVAPLIVPVALVLTKWEDDKLPWLFQWWDNDVSINGDDPKYWPLDYAGDTYYCAGHHPRSRWARFVWLGLRNRASRLSQMLGKRWIDPLAKSKVYGIAGLVEDTEGWNINVKEGAYQLIYIKKLGPLAYELGWGHKIWARVDGRPVANVICNSFSLKAWKGK